MHILQVIDCNMLSGYSTDLKIFRSKFNSYMNHMDNIALVWYCLISPIYIVVKNFNNCSAVFSWTLKHLSRGGQYRLQG